MTAFLALWNDVERGREPEYDEWHTREHVPERVACPGFLSGRRYVDRGHPTHRYFTFYEVNGIGAFRSPQYLDLLSKPTPWSSSMRPSFRNFLRVPCTQLHAAGCGLGAALAVLRIPLAAGIDAANEVDALMRWPGIVAARLGRHVAGTPSVAWHGAAPDPGTDTAFDAVLVLEATDGEAARQGLAVARDAFGVTGMPTDLGGTYNLLFVFPGANPQERLTHRRHSWDAVASLATGTTP